MKSRTNLITLEISVIIPVYNAEKYLSDAVDSALLQSQTAEILLIEDGATDNSLKVCLELEKKHSIVTVFRHPDKGNHGAGASRNLGILQAKSPYIAFLDADDFFLENAFTIAEDIFHKKIDAIATYSTHNTKYQSIKLKEKYKNYGIIHPIPPDIKPEDLFESLLSGDWAFSINSMVINRKFLLDNCRFSESLKLAQDTDFIFRLSLAGRIYPASINKPVYTYRIHSKNRVHNVRLAKRYKYQNYHYWFNQIQNNKWTKKVNRRITLQMIDGRIIHKNAYIRKALKAFYLIFLFMQHPKTILKLL